MDLQHYISSGVLELYVLDRLPPAEARAVEAMAAEHPAVRAELESIERTLEELILTNAPEPDETILRRVLSHPAFVAAVTADGNVPSTDKDQRPAHQARPQVPKSEHEKAVRGPNAVRNWLTIGLAVLALAAAVYYWNLGRADRQALDDLQLRYDEQEIACLGTRDTLELTRELIVLLTDPATRSVLLDGTDNAPAKAAIVFYSPATQRTLFRGTELPPPPAGKQYQLWAIDAGGPKSLGVLDPALASDTLLEVDYVPRTATFAVTLEDVGGNPTPDLSTLQVIGNVPS